MDIKDQEENKDPMHGYIMVNVLEGLVRFDALKLMEQFGMCTCDRCLYDVLALTLNNIPPKYVVTRKGELFAKIESYGSQYKTDITAKLTQACLLVKESPNH